MIPIAGQVTMYLSRILSGASDCTYHLCVSPIFDAQANIIQHFTSTILHIEEFPFHRAYRASHSLCNYHRTFPSMLLILSYLARTYILTLEVQFDSCTASLHDVWDPKSTTLRG